MQFSNNNLIPGVMTKGTEFFINPDGKQRTFHNTIETEFEQLPEYVLNAIKNDMGKPLASIEEMKAHAFNKWGGMDRKIDIDENGVVSEPEYIHNVSSAHYDNGEKISEAQLRVLKLIHLDDKTIANQLFISTYTVARHCQDLYNNSGIKSRTQLALWATNKGIL